MHCCSMSTSSSTTMRTITPVAALHPYKSDWTIKVVVTDKGIMHTYKRANEDGCVFNIELTDEEGTQIKATMFNAAAKKFYNIFEMGKVYFISKGNIKVTNNRFRTVDNDYEITLNNYSHVEEAAERIILPEKSFTFVSIDQLGEYVDRQSHVDVIGVVIRVAPTTFVKRKFDSKVVPKRDVTIMVNETGFWCVFCQKFEEACSLRYVLLAKFVDMSGEGWFSLFNDEAEALLGCSAEELEKMKLEDEGAKFQLQLKKATWVPHLFKISVAPKEYNGVRRQNIIVKSIASVDYMAESKLLLEEICLRK